MSIGRRFGYKAEATKGVIKKNIGRATGNRRLQMEGRVDQATGNTKNAGERVKEAFTRRPPYRTNRNRRQVVIMIVLGLILLVAGYLLGVPILTTLGIILLIVGLILLVMGSMGRPAFGRRHYY